jgi:membrane-bound lytic murein transglycosylase D
VGDTVVIPALRETAPYPGLPSRVEAQAPASGAAPELRGGEKAAWTGIYRVQTGDTLWSIARRYFLSVQELADNNGLSPEGLLFAGTVLQVPGDGE